LDSFSAAASIPTMSNNFVGMAKEAAGVNKSQKKEL
jgi:hypothetical protein